MAGPKSATEIMMLHDAARRRDVAIAAGIRESLYGESPIFKWMNQSAWTSQYLNDPISKGPDMSKFTEWLMEMYPKTEDYVYIHGLRTEGKTSKRELYLRIKPDPQAFLEQMKEFDKMMKEED